MSTETFDTDFTYDKRSHWFYFRLLLLLACPMFGASFADKFYNYDLTLVQLAVRAGTQAAFYAGIMVLIQAFILDSRGNTTFSVEARHFFCCTKNSRRCIDLATLRKLVVRRNPFREIVALTLYPDTGPRTQFGLIKNAERLLPQILKALPETTKVVEKNTWVTLDSSWAIVAWCVLSPLAAFGFGALFYTGVGFIL